MKKFFGLMMLSVALLVSFTQVNDDQVAYDKQPDPMGVIVAYDKQPDPMSSPSTDLA